MRRELINPPSGGYVVFDLETTGLRTPGDEIIEIGAVRCNEQGAIIDAFEELVRPSCPIGYNSTCVHGITENMVAGCRTIQEVLPDFLRFIGNVPLVGHNIKSFDMRFLDDACRRVGLPHLENDIFDTLGFSRKLANRGESCSVEALVNRYGLEKRHAHRALPDVLMERDVLLALCKEAKAKQLAVQTADINKWNCHEKGNAEKPQTPKRVLKIYRKDREAFMEIEGFLPLKKIVAMYSFLRWIKRSGRWVVKVDSPVPDNLEIFYKEVRNEFGDVTINYVH